MADNKEEGRSRQSQESIGDPRSQSHTATAGRGEHDQSRNEVSGEERGSHKMDESQRQNPGQHQQGQHQQNSGQTQRPGNMERESTSTGRKESEGTRGEQGSREKQDDQRRKSA